MKPKTLDHLKTAGLTFLTLFGLQFMLTLNSFSWDTFTRETLYTALVVSTQAGIKEILIQTVIYLKKTKDENPSQTIKEAISNIDKEGQDPPSGLLGSTTVSGSSSTEEFKG